MANNYGIKVSLPGKSVYSTEPRDFALHSKYSTVKIVQEATNKVYETVTVGGSSTVTVTIPHLLGFIPLCMVFTELNPGSGRWYNGVALAGPVDFTQTCFLNTLTSGTYADTVNLYLSFRNDSGGSQTIKYYYYIFGDNGA